VIGVNVDELSWQYVVKVNTEKQLHDDEWLVLLCVSAAAV